MIQFADRTMLQHLKLIWKECFHDPDEYIDFFFKSYFNTRTTLVYCINKIPVSMLTLMPANLYSSESITKIYYIYAVATLPSCQGKGYSSKLLQYANEITNTATFLQPANKDLERFYQRNGYQISVNRRITNITDIDVTIGEVSAVELTDNKSCYQIDRKSVV